MIKLFKLALLPALLATLSLHAADVPNNELTPSEKSQGWVLLFDGRTTQGWTKVNGQPVSTTGWRVKDGVLSTVPAGKGGDIVTVDEYSDFELAVDFRMTPACNSGIKYFFTKYPKGGNLGMEYQIIDDQGAEDIRKANHLCGSFYDVIPPDESRKHVNPPGEWNTAKIVCRGRHVEHWLNGTKILEFERGSPAYLAAVAKSKFKTKPVFGTVEKGRILLQDHGHEIFFRNVKIRRL